MTLAIALTVVAFLVVAVMLSRQTAKAKKRAIADLKEEKESVGAFDIFELVESEVETLGLESLDGAQGIPHGVLLKTWSENEDVVHGCSDREYLRYVVRSGVNPSEATEGDVTLECLKENPESSVQSQEDAGEPEDDSSMPDPVG